MKRLLTVSVALALSACGTTNNYLAKKTKTTEYYRIYDLKTTTTRSAIARAACDGLGRNVNNAQEATPIPKSSEPPEKPGRFQIVEPFKDSNPAADPDCLGIDQAKWEPAPVPASRSGTGLIQSVRLQRPPMGDGLESSLGTTLKSLPFTRGRWPCRS